MYCFILLVETFLVCRVDGLKLKPTQPNLGWELELSLAHLNSYFGKGLIYFPDFCELVLKRFRQPEDEEEDFFQNVFKVLTFNIKQHWKTLFKMMCGTEPYPTDFRAKKYKLNKHYLTKEDFKHVMKNLPVPVADEDIEEMFEFADKNKDGKLSYKEFEVCIKLISM